MPRVRRCSAALIPIVFLAVVLGMSDPLDALTGNIEVLWLGHAGDHLGDTGVFADMKWIGEYDKPDLIMIPFGGHLVMSPKDAAVATEMNKPTFAIPIHYGTLPVLKGTPQEYMQALGTSSVKVFPINPGDKLAFP